MVPLKPYHHFSSLSISIAPTFCLQPHFSSPPVSFNYRFHAPKSHFKLKNSFSFPTSNFLKVSRIRVSVCTTEYEEGEENKPSTELMDLSPNGPVYQKTLQLVECSMFAALTGLVYFLSNSLAIEVATTVLLFVLSGPVKALTYLLKHGIVGYTMGILWRSGASWNLSIFLCTIVRSLGAVGFVLISSFLIRENILALITINIHASLTFLLTASGVNSIPSLNMIYTLFGILVLINSGCFMFLLHLLYSVFLARMGMKSQLRLPRWLERNL
ncbi:uncharacterized protein LOC107618054 isoform X2 [Arachis ipaensis]|uniref:uncharacterized protein LOC107618054 isoform X2 n=1 Tax=Arachis ipaensis TaxID=130454 RepID=UPI000A2B2AF3|nr:uncharacterized protein LOC107618054 isoform X2 [Arachis ipaensis]XP_025626772.1 uncharacterized protein LOC112720146 isoform X2 [Arachis hypogaea]